MPKSLFCKSKRDFTRASLDHHYTAYGTLCSHGRQRVFFLVHAFHATGLCPDPAGSLGTPCTPQKEADMLAFIVISVVIALYAAYRGKSGVFALFFLLSLFMAFWAYVL